MRTDPCPQTTAKAANCRTSQQNGQSFKTQQRDVQQMARSREAAACTKLTRVEVDVSSRRAESLDDPRVINKLDACRSKSSGIP